MAIVMSRRNRKMKGKEREDAYFKTGIEIHSPRQRKSLAHRPAAIDIKGVSDRFCVSFKFDTQTAALDFKKDLVSLLRVHGWQMDSMKVRHVEKDQVVGEPCGDPE